MADDLNKLGLRTPWTNLTRGMTIAGAGTSKDFLTGEWSSIKPQWIQDKCKQCLICTPACPDSCIPVVDKKRVDFDYAHCKGCGICVKVCPFKAIEMEGMN